jgi:hypothetical protein
LYWIEETEPDPTDYGYSYNYIPIRFGGPDCVITQQYLRIGQPGVVVSDFGTNNIHSQPSLSSEIIGFLEKGDVFDVRDGPICAEGILWWRIDYYGLIGWTPGGAGERRFVNDYYSEFLYNYISR